MGQKASKTSNNSPRLLNKRWSSSTKGTNPVGAEEASSLSGGQEQQLQLPKGCGEYQLKKHRPGCTGMFWRSDPTKTTQLASNNDWPRDNALLRGKPVEVDGEKWLLTVQVKQQNADWIEAPVGAAMPFEFDDHYYLEEV